jgi:DNA-binding NarL/FixJ family response regulator
VLIVDDHPVVRQGLRVLLEVQDGFEVTGEAGDGPTAVALAKRRTPDVILLDLKLPGQDGLAVLAELHADGSQARVLILTSVTGRAGPCDPRRPRRPPAARVRGGRDPASIRPPSPDS